LERSQFLSGPTRNKPVLKHYEKLVAKLLFRLWLIDYFGGGYDMPLADYYAGTDGVKI